ncbi:hypothetical protein QTP88_008712 [Uroleucon formosanum]
MPAEGDCLEFDAWNTERHPIVMYADFEALLLKADGEKKGKNTYIIHKHEPMSFGIFVKAPDDVPSSLLEDYDTPTKPNIYRGSKERWDVAMRFMEMVTEISLKIEKLLKTNSLLHEPVFVVCNTLEVIGSLFVSILILCQSSGNGDYSSPSSTGIIAATTSQGTE